MELWKSVVGYEGYYEVSSLGRIRSVGRVRCDGIRVKDRYLKPNRLKDGYEQVALCKDRSRSYQKIHRLVALAFIDNPNNKPDVNHKNGIKHDNNVENLEWVTKSENSIHAYRVLGIKPNKAGLGKPSCRRKLNRNQIAEIQNDTRSQIKIAADYGVSQQTISNVKRNLFYASW